MTTLTSSSPPSLATSAPRIGTRQAIDFALLTFMLTNLAWSMVSAQWSSGLEQLFPVVILASLAGTLIALSGFGRGFATLYSLIVGSATILFSLSRLAPAGLNGQERVYHILTRLYVWMQAALTPQPLADNLVFVLILAILMWILAFGATWAYFREQEKWQAILPTGLAMLVNLYYAPPQLNAYFVLYLFSAILLLIRATLSEHEREWRQAHVFFPFDISFDFMRDGVLFALFVIITAWVLPTSMSQGKMSALLDPLQKPWQQFQQEWDKLFSTLNYGRTVGVPSFGTSLALGGPRTVTDELIMDVDTPVDRYYRAAVYDTYLPGGWVLRQSVGIKIGQEAIVLPTYKARLIITETITTYQPGNVLFAAPQPIAVELPADARVLLLEPEETTSDETAPPKGEYAMLVSQRSLRAGDSYVVHSAIAIPTIAELRSDHSNYPQSIRERYLQLPDTVPPRVFDLTEDIVKNLDNPYDRAKQIETFLRGYAYNDQIPGPVPGQDAVDYFLFEERQGYCNYYASSMVVMLRHLGIPARLAAGYATGEYQEATGLYRIRDRDSHTWVEVYFPTYGWVEFEPTASEPVLPRPAGTAPADEDKGTNPGTGAGDLNPDKENNIPLPDEVGLNSSKTTTFKWLNQNLGIILLLGSIIGILLVSIWSVRRLQRPQRGRRPFMRTVPPEFSSRLWHKLMRWCRRLGISPSPSLTPYEQAALMRQTLPQAGAKITTIAELYARDLYSPYEITPTDASEAQLSWLELRPLLWKRWLRQRLHLK
ncbi:MAG: transglutaminase domain-containing protein [Chloroflexi bacterium]|nr:transglutaminase domain-containing protein [Chloroflexota bacterium]